MTDPALQALSFTGARMIDRLVRRDGAWGIAHRQLVWDWNHDAPEARDYVSPITKLRREHSSTRSKSGPRLRTASPL